MTKKTWSTPKLEALLLEDTQTGLQNTQEKNGKNKNRAADAATSP